MLAGNRAETCIKHWNLITKIGMPTTNSIFFFFTDSQRKAQTKVHLKDLFQYDFNEERGSRADR